ncbi:3-phosphoshikimate 1-carboxyvinyltransferase [Muricauda sp. SCSIO 64092]|uniref:3-phosphoshikimate 1-carboxyvinyltransferase n=1 Tax=Allomuricauda sp. SCSIO 64092 TaxID=2908842 RepID=UPI001FF1D741|nr:3-phosphoshikimate 1-carboxyvinyltransferase [Muricauda sp. SCSIO 64092]UOY07608.1 3-phosphoshikimate 1-carboxyvinyltransferase [Muricauda sp. SCSIO 64092]
MKLHLSAPSNTVLDSEIAITGSKSETNRLLLLQALFPNLGIENGSNSDDAEVMQKGLAISKGVVDIHHAGTAMRFLTSYFASQEGKEVLLTGSKRMKQRPIKVLVDALKGLGADIEYQENEGYPPLKIKGKKIKESMVGLPADISSQYISSLCLVAPSLENGLTIDLIGKITSVPYIKMTLGLLKELGVGTSFQGNQIRIHPQPKIGPLNLVVESDWSAASYYYSIAALAALGSEIKLSSYKRNSLQGDSVLSEIYKDFGVDTDFARNSIVLKKTQKHTPKPLHYDLSNAPDIAQTIAVTCFGLGMECRLTGLHTLPIKETDRLAAMKTELEKFGASVVIDHESLALQTTSQLNENVAVDTYNDHRMAMAFAPLALKIDLMVNDAGVVSKSYPDFWNHMKKVGFKVSHA